MLRCFAVLSGDDSLFWWIYGSVGVQSDASVVEDSRPNNVGVEAKNVASILLLVPKEP